MADDGNAAGGRKAGEALKVFWDGAARRVRSVLPPTFTPGYWPTRYCCRAKCWKVSPPHRKRDYSLPAQPLIRNIRKPMVNRRAIGDNHSSRPAPLADNHAVNRRIWNKGSL
ncbi:hypothetical protein KCP69_07990 [Salmonella enterica subsp. enterica]|nr:hypothetical protein KCP69_07990 [Salmonella enterica subsp. enterica]